MHLHFMYHACAIVCVPTAKSMHACHIVTEAVSYLEMRYMQAYIL